MIRPIVPASLRALARSTRAAALTEFAIVTPVMLLLGMGGVEMANYVAATIRVSQIAMTVADNAGRVRTSIDEADVNEIMLGARKVGEPIDFTANGRIILSDLEMRTNSTNAGGSAPVDTLNPNGYKQWIRWQRCSGALNVTSSYGLPRNASGNAVTNLDNTTNADHGAVETRSTLLGMGPAENMITASPGTAVMVAEVQYTYQPVVPIDFFGTMTISRVQAFNVRQRTAYPLRNDGSLSGNSRSDCRLFSATVPT